MQEILFAGSPRGVIVSVFAIQGDLLKPKLRWAVWCISQKNLRST
jgi:hypothetical protein